MISWFQTLIFDREKSQIHAFILQEYNIYPYLHYETQLPHPGHRAYGLSSKDALEKSVVWLRDKYETTGDVRYLDKAVWHIPLNII